MLARGYARWSCLLIALTIACAPPSSDAIPADQTPRRPVEERASPRHFITPNESRHDLFATAIADRGGVYVGVGSEQNYTMLATSRAARAYVVDRDPMILALHRHLLRAVADARDPVELLRTLADPEGRPPGALGERWPRFVDHLAVVAGREGTWLGDHELYRRVRVRARGGRIHLLHAELGATPGLAAIGEALRRDELRLSVLYVSNAEESIADVRQLRADLAALPQADALILRTFYREPWPAADGLWSYQVQPLTDLLRVLDRPEPPTIAAMIDEATARGAIVAAPGEPGLTWLASG